MKNLINLNNIKYLASIDMLTAEIDALTKRIGML